jgi:CRISPR-associated protein Cas5d
MNRNQINLRVWGEWACFTRPEMKVERVSYPLMTPSAARGVLEAIFWEPQMYYLIDQIRVVRRGRWAAFRRNEVTSRISLRNTREWMTVPEKFQPIQAGGGAPDGTQRNMLALANVEYIISAEVHLSELGKRSGQNERKYVEEINRRARSGKCFHRPSLGAREFAADFEGEDDAEAAHMRRLSELKDASRDWTESMGLMLYDLFDADERTTGFRWLSDEEVIAANTEREVRLKELKPAERRKLARESVSRIEGQLVRPQATFFRAHVKDSVLDCHPSRVEIVRREA